MITLNQQTISIATPSVTSRRHSVVAQLKGAARWLWASRASRTANLNPDPLFCDREVAFVLGLAAVGQRAWALAERELTNGNGHRALSDAHCLNLLGVVKSTGRWGLARQCYSRAIHKVRRFNAPRINLQRYYELTTFGRTRLAACLGNEKDVLS